MSLLHEQLSQALLACDSERKQREEAEKGVLKQRACFDEAQALWAAETVNLEQKASKIQEELNKARDEAKLQQKQVRLVCLFLCENKTSVSSVCFYARTKRPSRLSVSM